MIQRYRDFYRLIVSIDVYKGLTSFFYLYFQVTIIHHIEIYYTKKKKCISYIQF